MNADKFYTQIVDYMALPPLKRHNQMAQLHTQIANEYVAALQRLTIEDVAKPVSVGTDERTLAQIIGHITEWERFGLLATGDMLAGVQHPRTVTDVQGFIEADGSRIDFANVDEFNHYQAKKYRAYSWPQLQTMAIDSAETLHALFTHPHLLTAERLEQTLPHRKRLGMGPWSKPQWAGASGSFILIMKQLNTQVN